ncbi:MAG TPA: NADH-quinone oxidoreductase subunit C [Gammaproteobacteria bacterium]|nr:NADH-quinone oxidoreductase subunit C [Gammaproteobacteria bacterium]
MSAVDRLQMNIAKHLRYCTCILSHDSLTLEVSSSEFMRLMNFLKTHADFDFDTLIDLCVVDYLSYGQSEWETREVTSTGYSRAVDPMNQQEDPVHPRFAVVYHCLSTRHNHRVRVRCFVENKALIHPSVEPLWGAANWYEREAFDLMGILFDGHPDLRRILTDYGFMGHPFRKDFPLSGEVEVRYDATLARCVYEPVDLEPRTTVPKTIRGKGSSSMGSSGAAHE